METKGNEKSLEEEDHFRSLKVKNEDTTIAPYMVRSAATEEGEEEPDEDIDVEDDTGEGYKDEEDVE